jgi:hypothetical protein
MKAMAGIVLFIFVIWGMFLALPVFAAIVGTGIAGAVLWAMVTETS